MIGPDTHNTTQNLFRYSVFGHTAVLAVSAIAHCAMAIGLGLESENFAVASVIVFALAVPWSVSLIALTVLRARGGQKKRAEGVLRWVIRITSLLSIPVGVAIGMGLTHLSASRPGSGAILFYYLSVLIAPIMTLIWSTWGLARESRSRSWRSLAMLHVMTPSVLILMPVFGVSLLSTLTSQSPSSLAWIPSIVWFFAWVPSLVTIFAWFTTPAPDARHL